MAEPGLAGFFVPADPLPVLWAAYALAALVYARGLWRRRSAGDIAPALAFYLGLAGLYLWTQTALDGLGRELFFVHRGQHLVLHHLAPFFMALSLPSAVIAAGLPGRQSKRVSAWRMPRPVVAAYRLIQQPLIGGALFVALIALWLTPAVHHWAMASRGGYWLMNGSMALEGLAFWWFMLDPRPPQATPTTHSIATRIAVLWAVMPPQIVIGATITLSAPGLYPGYHAAERAWGITAGLDQQIGGILTWIPPAMMSVVGTLVILRFAFAHERDRSRPVAGRVDRGPAESATS
ncbi:cytochrome c oxidase assembly protein [uncultured Salinisphaera sp.]|uniref:cytochrome c oxidase assembly protein n=1 Tax=uncultured Salinisphaera sp. TaxID=359372 RepID=UPI0032B193F8